MEELMVKIEDVKKMYKLGEIGGTTLRDELQRLHAKLHNKPDPTKRIGAKDYNRGETFMALNGVSFEVKKGERVGIIGHNGAGKSTLLKLISRVTAPTEGTICLNGRVASMLEVGTGFHAELTGRENVYMNGAILGMTKKEIDKKMEDIIEFSEVRQFIDTPVKRYSSGMYVKLAFSVAAHLDSEIMIMDEVLAVGDMAFQKKCIEKMNQVSKDEGRTILYVSHNMNTIRQLCDRVVVLDHGTVIFNGDVEGGIELYAGFTKKNEKISSYSLPRLRTDIDSKIHFNRSEFLTNNEYPIFSIGEPIKMKLVFQSSMELNNIAIRYSLKNIEGNGIGMATTKPIINAKQGINTIMITLQTNYLSPGEYVVDLVAYSVDEFGNSHLHDVVNNAFTFKKVCRDKENNNIVWNHNWWGYVMFPTMEVE